MHNHKKTVPPPLYRALGAFDVASFYSILRANGCDPVVHNGALHMALSQDSAAVRAAGAWAAQHDPSGVARLEFARAAWQMRQPHTDTVRLG